MSTGSGRRVHMPLRPISPLDATWDSRPPPSPDMGAYLNEVEELLQDLEETQDEETRQLISNDLTDRVVEANLSYSFSQVLDEFEQDLAIGLATKQVDPETQFEEVLWYRWKLYCVSRWN